MKSIRAQLTRHVVLAAAAPFAIAWLTTYYVVGAELREQFDAALRARALAASGAVHAHGDVVEVDESSRLFQELDESVERGESQDWYFELRRADGRSVRRSRSLADGDLPWTGSRHVTGDVRLPDGRPGRFWTMPVPSVDPAASTSEPPLIITVAADRTELDDALRVLSLMVAGAGVAVLALTVGIMPRLVRRAFRPVRAVADWAAAITPETLGARFDVEPLPIELRAIGDRLNGLLSRLQAAFDRERQFSADLAHELRTPVAELRAIAELVTTWPDDRPVDADRDILAIAAHMESIVTRLLAMLRSPGASGQPARGEMVDLRDLVRQAWRARETAAIEKGLILKLEDGAGGEIDTDGVSLRSIVTNLIDNAIDYAPSATVVQANVRSTEDETSLLISNDAADLSMEDLDRLFERFWRGDPSRSGGTHVGLGLPLARSFARALGGDLTASLDGGRLVMTLQVPRASRVSPRA